MDRFKAFIKRELLYGGITPKEYELILPDIKEENRKSLIAFSAITCIFLLVMFLLSFISEDVKENRWIYVFTMLLSAAIFVIASTAKNGKSAVLYVDIYAFVILLFTFGIILGTVTRPEEQTVTFVALLLTVPLLFTDRPVKMIVCIYAFIISFVITATQVKADNILTADIIDVTVFGTISAIISTYMTNLKCHKFLYARKVSVLSETDLLTGLCNRNSFEQKLKAFSSLRDRTLSCIYVDINGLHEMNNTKGHGAGDDMLQFVGKTFQQEFGEKNTFRLGGDEFVALITDEKEDAIQEKIDRMKFLVEEKAYHVSIGYSIGNSSETDLSSLIRNAEKRMYEAKSSFYRQNGMDRRTRM